MCIRDSVTAWPEVPGTYALRSVSVATGGDDDQITRLAKCAGRGDRAALSEFIQATQRDVWRTVAYLADPASADDLTQETFLRAIGSLPRFTGRSTARTWLLSIARRVVAVSYTHLDVYKRQDHCFAALRVQSIKQDADFHYVLDPAATAALPKRVVEVGHMCGARPAGVVADLVDDYATRDR